MVKNSENKNFGRKKHGLPIFWSEKFLFIQFMHSKFFTSLSTFLSRKNYFRYPFFNSQSLLLLSNFFPFKKSLSSSNFLIHRAYFPRPFFLRKVCFRYPIFAFQKITRYPISYLSKNHFRYSFFLLIENYFPRPFFPSQCLFSLSIFLAYRKIHSISIFFSFKN